MSFTSDPFKNATIIQDDDYPGRSHLWECPLCGARSDRSWPSTSALWALIGDYYKHLSEKHGLNQEERAKVIER